MRGTAGSKEAWRWRIGRRILLWPAAMRRRGRRLRCALGRIGGSDRRKPAPLIHWTRSCGPWRLLAVTARGVYSGVLSALRGKRRERERDEPARGGKGLGASQASPARRRRGGESRRWRGGGGGGHAQRTARPALHLSRRKT